MSSTADIPALVRLAYAQEGLFTSGQAHDYDVSPQLLSHHARSGRFQRVRRGLYRLAGYPPGRHEAVRAAWLTVGADRAIVSHESALLLHCLWRDELRTTHLLVARAHRGIRPPPGVTLHTAAALPERQVTTRFGMRVSAPAQAIVESALAGGDCEQLRRAAVEALRGGCMTAAQLVALARGQGTRAQVLVGRAVAAAGLQESVGRRADAGGVAGCPLAQVKMICPPAARP